MKKLIIGGISGLILIILLFLSLTTIVEGRIGIQYRLGKLLAYPIQPGVHFTIPFIDHWDILDTREQTYDYVTSTYTKDTQTVERFECIVNYAIKTDETSLYNLIKNIGVNHIEEKILIPYISSIVKNCVGQYKGEDLVQNRSKLESEIYEKLADDFEKNCLRLCSVNIKEIDFTDSFETIIAEKVAAEQDALKTKNQTAKVQEEANQTKIKAEADADAKKIKADAEAYAIQKVQEELSKSPNYNDYVRANRWNGELPKVMGNSVNPFVDFESSSK